MVVGCMSFNGIASLYVRDTPLRSHILPPACVPPRTRRHPVCPAAYYQTTFFVHAISSTAPYNELTQPYNAAFFSFAACPASQTIHQKWKFPSSGRAPTKPPSPFSMKPRRA